MIKERREIENMTDTLNMDRSLKASRKNTEEANEKPNENVYYILGIEGSANKLGISIINKDNEILVNSRRTFVSEIGCGFIPREVSAHHRYFIIELIEECLKKVQIKITDIGLICYTKGPGIGSALYIGYNVCKIFSALYNIPVVGVNHCIAHIEMGIFITKLYHPIILYVSGSNTQIIYYNDHKKKYEIVGETLDIAIGNVIDRSARIMKISNAPSPGYNVEQLAKKKRLLNVLKRREMRKKSESKENSLSNANDLNESSPNGNIKEGGNELNGKKKNEEKYNRSNYDKDIDYTELLFFPYTIKGMDISFSGYDFYINKYFAKYIQKNKQLEKLNLKKRQKDTEKHKKFQEDQKENKQVIKKIKAESEIEQDKRGTKNEIKKIEDKCESNNGGNITVDSTEKEAQTRSDHSNTEGERLSDVPGAQGKSYLEENIIFENEHKQNYGENDIYAEDICSIETDSDFYERQSSDFIDDTEAEKVESKLLNLSDEEKRKIQICYSLQHHIFSMLIEITERAISFTNSKEVIIVGGVGCNVFLQSMMKKMAKQKNVKIGFMDHSYCVDNGAMIAYTGYLEYIHAKDKTKYNFENISIHQRFRTDDVYVTWR